MPSLVQLIEKIKVGSGTPHIVINLVNVCILFNPNQERGSETFCIHMDVCLMLGRTILATCSQPSFEFQSEICRLQVIRMTHKNMQHWHKDYFELKTIEKQQMPKKALCLPPHLPKIILRLSLTEDSYKPRESTERNL